MKIHQLLYFLLLTLNSFSLQAGVLDSIFGPAKATYDSQKKGCYRPDGSRATNDQNSSYCSDCHTYECCTGGPDREKTKKLFKSCNTHLLDYQAPSDKYKINLKGAALSDVDLSNVNLNAANLEGANLVRTKLQGTHLQGANLENTKIDGASFHQAHLEFTNFYGAEIRNTNFADAYMESSNFISSKIENSPFDKRHEKYVISEIGQLCEKGEEKAKQLRNTPENDRGEWLSIQAAVKGMENSFNSYNKDKDVTTFPGNSTCLSLINKMKQNKLAKEYEELMEKFRNDIEEISGGSYSVNLVDNGIGTVRALISPFIPLVSSLFPVPDKKVREDLEQRALERQQRKIKDITDRYEKKRAELKSRLQKLVDSEMAINDQARNPEARRENASADDHQTPVPRVEVIGK